MKNRKFTIKKVPLDSLLQILSSMFSSGADYVDLHGLIDEESKQDQVTVSTKSEYLNMDFVNREKEEEELDENDIPEFKEEAYSNDDVQSYKETEYKLDDDDILNLLKNGL